MLRQVTQSKPQLWQTFLVVMGSILDQYARQEAYRKHVNH